MGFEEWTKWVKKIKIKMFQLKKGGCNVQHGDNNQ